MYKKTSSSDSDLEVLTEQGTFVVRLAGFGLLSLPLLFPSPTF